MGPREGRLRAMLDKGGLWGGQLGDEDRDAIQWAFERIKTLENDLAQSRENFMGVSALAIRRLTALNAVIDAAKAGLP